MKRVGDPSFEDSKIVNLECGQGVLGRITGIGLVDYEQYDCNTAHDQSYLYLEDNF